MLLTNLSGGIKAAQALELGVINEVIKKEFLIRQKQYYEDGLTRFQQILSVEGIDYWFISESLNLKQTDSRYLYIHYLPEAAFLAAARGLAIEKSICNRSTNEVAELAMLFSIFTNLLDGILDETPEILAPDDLHFLSTMMIEQPWAKGLQNLPEVPHHHHPVVYLLFKVMFSIIKRVVSAVPWSSDAILRTQFISASKAAFVSEYNSAKYVNLSLVQFNFAEAQEDLRQKSCSWSWVVSMVPFCIHGWPSQFDTIDFKEFTLRLGVLGGWLDDISDIDQDLKTNKWSNVFLEIYKKLGGIQYYKYGFPFVLQHSLCDSSIIRHLAKTGRIYYDQLIDSMKKLPMRQDILTTSIQDNILTFLIDVEEKSEEPTAYEQPSN